MRTAKRKPPARPASESALWKEATLAAIAWVDNWGPTLSNIDRARIIYVFRDGYIKGRLLRVSSGDEPR